MKINKVSIDSRLLNFAKYNGMGIGSLSLNDGIKLKILSNPYKEIFHVFQIKNDQIIKAEGGKGVIAMSKIIDKYNQKVLFNNHGKKDIILDAFYHSFQTYI